MRIGIIAGPWAPVPPTGYGAIEVLVDELATGFQSAGHEVLLFTVGSSTCPVPRSWLLDDAVQPIGQVVPEMRHVIAAYEELRAFDVVHDHTIFGPLYAQRFPDVRVVTTAHGPFDTFTPIYERVAERATILAVSRAQARAASHIASVQVIHHGLDASRYPFAMESGGYCLFLGRFNPDKGAHRAIAAATSAGLPLLLAGKAREPHEIEYLERHVKPLLNDDVRYLGEVGHAEKLELLAGARCLLFPIRWPEPFGIVMIEAMACGTPVLAYPEGAVPEVVEDGVTGFLCRGVAEMADAIGQAGALDRGRCRAAVEGYFSKDRMVAEHLRLFETLVGTGRRPA